MNRRHVVLSLLTALALPALSTPTMAQNFPNRVITFVVPFGPAAGADMIARSLAQGMSRQIDQMPLVENRPGGNAIIGAQTVLRAPADGHTVLISSNSPVIFNRFMFKNIPYDSIKDFTPVAAFCKGSIVLTVNSKSQFQSVAELVDFGRKNPGKLTVGYSSSASRLAEALFQQLTRVEMLEVPYKDFAQSLVGQVSGDVDVLFPPPDLASPQLKSGAIRPLAVTGTMRMSKLLPDVPTLQEAGVPSYEFTFWYGAWVKAGTPMPVIQKLRDGLLKAMDGPESRRFMEANACEPLQLTREEFARFQDSELERWGKVTKEARIEPQ